MLIITCLWSRPRTCSLPLIFLQFSRPSCIQLKARLLTVVLTALHIRLPSSNEATNRIHGASVCTHNISPFSRWRRDAWNPFSELLLYISNSLVYCIIFYGFLQIIFPIYMDLEAFSLAAGFVFQMVSCFALCFIHVYPNSMHTKVHKISFFLFRFKMNICESVIRFVYINHKIIVWLFMLKTLLKMLKALV